MNCSSSDIWENVCTYLLPIFFIRRSLFGSLHLCWWLLFCLCFSLTYPAVECNLLLPLVQVWFPHGLFITLLLCFTSVTSLLSYVGLTQHFCLLEKDYLDIDIMFSWCSISDRYHLAKFLPKIRLSRSIDDWVCPKWYHEFLLTRQARWIHLSGGDRWFLAFANSLIWLY